MWATTHYVLHDLILEVKEKEQGPDLTPFFQDYSFFPTFSTVKNPSFSLSISWITQKWELPPTAKEVFRFEDLSGHTVNGVFYLKERGSILHLPVDHRWGEAFLCPDFFQDRPFPYQRLLGIGLVKLLRPMGYFALHAAGLVTPTGQGVLVVGVSGSGKSTLTIGLVRHGWGYLSDDAVLLHSQEEGVQALVFRQPFSIESKRSHAYADLPLGKEPPPSPGKQKRRLNMHEAFSTQHVSDCFPHILLFSKIVPRSNSMLVPVARSHGIGQLLGQSSPKVFDRPTMEDHLKLLTQLVNQCQLYELQAGLDLLHQPEILEDLLAEADRTTGSLV